jgi:hypothetical protein
MPEYNKTKVGSLNQVGQLVYLAITAVLGYIKSRIGI